MKSLLLQSICTAFLLIPVIVQGGYAGYVCPAGAKAGTECEVIIGGRGLQGIRTVIVDGDMSNRDVTVESVDIVPGGLYYIQKPEQKKYVDQWIRSLFNSTAAPKLPEDTVGWNKKNKYLNEVDTLTVMQREMLLRGFYTRPDPLQASPSISTKAIVKLKIAQNAKTGLHHLRFAGNGAVFNPVPFFISDKDEFSESLSLPPPATNPVPRVILPSVLNGQILPGETDLFHFQAEKGKIYTFRLYGRALLPFIGDGVPGHFQPVLQIRNKQGKELAFQDDTYFDPDPVLTFTVPENGEYTLAVRDAIYRGREDFVYRIDVSEGTYRYSFLPPPDWKLPIQKAKDSASGIMVPFPCAVEGTILPGKTQKIVFNLKKGTDAVLEIYARRALSPLDSRLTVFAPSGKRIAENDDFPRPKVGPVYHYADSWLRFTAPEDGVYTAEVTDTTSAGGNDYRYWLRISEPRPDFRIWSVPSGLNLSLLGGSTPVGFVVERVDGHKGDIVIQVNDTQNIVISGSNLLPYGDKRANSFESVCGLQMPFPDCAKDFLTLSIRGKKTDKRMEQLHLTAHSGNVMHPVVPADESMQAFAYNHLIVSDDCFSVKSWSHGGRFLWRKDTKTVQKIAPGQELTLEIDVREKIVPDSCSAELFAPPAGFTLLSCKQLPVEMSSAKQGKGSGQPFFRIVLNVKADSAMNPCRFNQIVQVHFMREKMDKTTNTRKQSKGSVFLPALMFQVEKP